MSNALRSVGRISLIIAGAVAGSFVGQPGLGAAIGASIGGILLPPVLPDQIGPRIDDLAFTGATPGAPIPKVYGTFPVSGTVLWLKGGKKDEIAETTSQGKGAPRQNSTQYRYEATFAIGLCEGPIDGVLAIYMDRKLVYRDDAALLAAAIAGADTQAIADAALLSVPGLDMTLYLGTETQTADPLHQADTGVNDTPAYRGLAYIVFNALRLDDFGARIPQIQAIVTTSSSDTYLQSHFDQTVNFRNAAQPQSGSKQGVYRKGSLYIGIEGDTGNLAAFSIVSGALIWRVSVPDYGSGFATLDGRVAIDETNGVLYLAHRRTSTGGPYVWQYDCVTGQLLSESTFGTTGLIEAHTVGEIDGEIYYMAFSNSGADLYIQNVSDGAAINGALAMIIDGAVYTEFNIASGRAIIDSLGRLWHTNPSGSQSTLYCHRIEGLGVANPIPITIYTIQSATQLGGNTGTVHGQIKYYADENKLLWTPMHEGVDDKSYLVDASDGSTTLLQWSDGTQYDNGYDDFNLEVPGFSSGGIDYFVSLASPLTSGFKYHTLDLATGIVAYPSLDPNLWPVNDGLQQNAFFIPWGNGIIHTHVTAATGAYFNFLPRISPGTVTLKSIVDAISADVGLAASDIDTADLSSITIRGYAIARQMSADRALIPLLDFKFVDVAEIDGVITYVPRGASASVVTIAEADLGASADGDIPESLIEEIEQHDAMPWRLDLTFIDPAREYQTGEAYAKRSDEAVSTRQTISQEFAIVMSADEGAQYTDKKLYQIWVERFAPQFSLPPKYGKYTPTDIITVTRGDVTYPRLRINTIDEGADGVLRARAVPDDASVFTSTRTGSSGGYVAQTLVAESAPGLFVFDTPALRDEENASSYLYVTAYRAAPALAFNGANISRSIDDIEYVPALFDSAVPDNGITTSDLAAPRSVWTWDRENTVSVRMVNGTLSSSTEADVLAGANAAYVGVAGQWEVMQYVNATLQSDGTYLLDTLLRGRRGTDDLGAAALSKGAAFVPIDSAKIDRIEIPSTYIGQAAYFKATALAGVDETKKTINPYSAATLKPYSPVSLAASRDGSNNATFTWRRRTRYIDAWGLIGTFPLGETTEQYRIRFYSGASVVRTKTATSETVGYTAAEQTTDGLTPGDPVKFDVAQYSGALDDYGFTREATL